MRVTKKSSLARNESLGPERSGCRSPLDIEIILDRQLVFIMLVKRVYQKPHMTQVFKGSRRMQNSKQGGRRYAIRDTLALLIFEYVYRSLPYLSTISSSILLSPSVRSTPILYLLAPPGSDRRSTPVRDQGCFFS